MLQGSLDRCIQSGLSFETSKTDPEHNSRIYVLCIFQTVNANTWLAYKFSVFIVNSPRCRECQCANAYKHVELPLKRNVFKWCRFACTRKCPPFSSGNYIWNQNLLMCFDICFYVSARHACILFVFVWWCGFLRSTILYDAFEICFVCLWMRVRLCEHDIANW